MKFFGGLVLVAAAQLCSAVQLADREVGTVVGTVVDAVSDESSRPRLRGMRKRARGMARKVMNKLRRKKSGPKRSAGPKKLRMKQKRQAAPAPEQTTTPAPVAEPESDSTDDDSAADTGAAAVVMKASGGTFASVEDACDHCSSAAQMKFVNKDSKAARCWGRKDNTALVGAAATVLSGQSASAFCKCVIDDPRNNGNTSCKFEE